MEPNTQIQSQPNDTPIVTLLRHNLWANLQLFDACAALDEKQLAAELVGGYGTIFDTLYHIARAEQNYLVLLTRQQPALQLRYEVRPEYAVMREQMRLSGEGLIAYATEQPPDAIIYDEDDDDKSLVWPIPARGILCQVINHATEHRAHVMTTLTQIGINPPVLDAWKYMNTVLAITPIQRSEVPGLE